MTSMHSDIEVTAGDDLVVPGTLLDIDGSPLDLTDAQLKWVLLDPNGAVAASCPGTVELAIWSPPTSGKITVALGGDITAELEIGRHTDALRVTTGLRQTLWRGCILVGASPPWPPAPPQGPLTAASTVIGSP
jgi:hypothetical protein